MFSLHDFLMNGFREAIRSGSMADYQITMKAAEWLDKGALKEEDLAELQAAMEARDAEQAAPVTDTTGQSAITE